MSSSWKQGEQRHELGLGLIGGRSCKRMVGVKAGYDRVR